MGIFEDGNLYRYKKLLFFEDSSVRDQKVKINHGVDNRIQDTKKFCVVLVHNDGTLVWLTDISTIQRTKVGISAENTFGVTVF